MPMIYVITCALCGLTESNRIQVIIAVCFEFMLRIRLDLFVFGFHSKSTQNCVPTSGCRSFSCGSHQPASSTIAKVTLHLACACETSTGMFGDEP